MTRQTLPPDSFYRLSVRNGINRYLATDLSAKGIAGAGNMISGLKTESVTVQRDLQASMGKAPKP